ncbi:bifunctional metallophosphatase/5'-nucleotidase [Neptunicella marina]|uniref:Bifunctional metallophosphatase/5'-nucleotidase n=1 Tax=Neptunicella marina TaxID=2125989 RepID=A0A8J6IX58_9ALTE|nr:5'-nucleotidase C-terminal domain-containing protein [Neptunicella marina]MBC3767157.1 bifunctional metallophosphatase/5'-nucleotidase [Neptunicella marina]
MLFIQYVATRLFMSCVICCISFYSFAQIKQATIVFTENMSEISQHNYGGYAELATLLKQQRKQKHNVFFLFGGSSIGPSSLSSLDKGAHIIDLLNSIGPDAMGVAKKDFSYLEDQLSLRSYEAAFPMVSSNIYDPLSDGILDGLVSSTIAHQGQVNIGVLSVLHQTVLSEYALERLEVRDPATAIREQAAILRRNNVDLIVLMYSFGLDDIQQLLDERVIDLSLHKDNYFQQRQLKPPQIHARDIFVTIPGSAGVIDLSWNNNQPETLAFDWRQVLLSDMIADPDLKKQVDSYSSRVNRLFNQPIGELLTHIDTRRHALRVKENAFANYVTDALVKYSGAEIGLLNSGTIRGDKVMKPGDFITRKDISQMLPYRNEVVTMQVPGSDIILALENGFKFIDEARGRYLQVSGLNVTYNSQFPPDKRVISVKVHGKPIVKDKIYSVVTSNYLAKGGDAFTMFADKKIVNLTHKMTRLLADVVVDQILTDKQIAPKEQNRLTDITLVPCKENSDC